MPQDHCFHLETVYSDEKGFSEMGRLEREREGEGETEIENKNALRRAY